MPAKAPALPALLQPLPALLETGAGPAANTQEPCGVEAKTDKISPALPALLLTTKDVMGLVGLKSRGAVYEAAAKGLIKKNEKVGGSGFRAGLEDNRYTAASVFAYWPHAKAAWEAQNRQKADREAEAERLREAAKADGQARAALSDYERGVADARKVVLGYIQSIVDEKGAGLEVAVPLFLARVFEGEAPEGVAAAFRAAHARRGATRKGLSARTVYRWMEEAAQGDAGLAPKVGRRAEPRWARYLLALYRRPQEPNLKQIVEVELPPALAEKGISPPSYSAARRWLEKVGAIEKLRGRKLDRALREDRPCRRRDAMSLGAPLVAVIADGHKFDAEVRDPKTGGPMRPEMTPVLDLYTRRCLAVSVGSAESALVVMEAIRQCVRKYGVPAIFYCDNGSGFNNGWVDGVMSRIGCTKTNSIPYNSMSRGVIERFHRTLFVEMCAKRLPTYMGDRMDKQARQIVYKDVRQRHAKGGASPALIPWEVFTVFVNRAVEAYNDRPHSALPWTEDDLGRRRHMTPNEMWERAVAGGWEPVRYEADELDELLPCEMRLVRRGEVSVLGNRYFSAELAEYHGDTVRVAFDPWDASRVWVRDRSGRLLAEARLNGNLGDYFPKNFVEQASEGRDREFKRRLEQKYERRLGGGGGADAIGMSVLQTLGAGNTEPTLTQTLTEAELRAAHEALDAAEAANSAMVDDPVGAFIALAQNPHLITAENRDFFDYFSKTKAGVAILGDLPATGALAGQHPTLEPTTPLEALERA